MQTTDVQSLGTDYNILNEDGDLVKSIKMIKHEDILVSALGEYSEEYYSDFNDYLKQSNEMLYNFATNPYKVYWHRCTEHDFDLIEIVDICVNNKYDFVILELYESDIEEVYLNITSEI